MTLEEFDKKRRDLIFRALRSISEFQYRNTLDFDHASLAELERGFAHAKKTIIDAEQSVETYRATVKE